MKRTNKKICKKLFLPRWIYTLYEQTFPNLRPFLSLTFSHGFRKSKQFAQWTLEIGGKKAVKGVRNCNYKKILLSKAKFAKKKSFFLRGDFTPFISKVFQSETTSFHFFPQRFWISKNFRHPTSQSGGKKTFKRHPKNEQTNRQTNTWTDIFTYRMHHPRGPMLWKWLYVTFIFSWPLLFWSLLSW